MSTTIDTLQIEIEASSSKAEKNISSLTKCFEKLNKISQSSGLSKMTSRLEKLSKLNFSNLKPLNNIGNMMSGIDKLGRKLDSISDKLSNMPSADVGVDVDTGKVESVVSTVSDILEGLPERETVTVDVENTERANSKLSLFSNTISKMKGLLSGTTSKLTKVSTKLSGLSAALAKTTKKASMLNDVLKIVLVYGGAFKGFMLLTQGVSEGLQNVAQYNAETAASMGRLSTMSLTLKNSIGASLYPVLVALTPVLQSITNAIARVCEGFSMLISLMSGKSTYLKAKVYAKGYVDTAKKAGADAAKAIKKSFAGMDEITTIGNKDTGSSGGSGGGGGDNYGQMFEEVPINNPQLEALLPFFQGLGAVLSSCFDTIKRLASDYLYPWLVNIGKWCSENPETLRKIGEGIAYMGLSIMALKGTWGILTKFSEAWLTLTKHPARLGFTLTLTGIGVEFAGIVAALKEGLNGLNFTEMLGGGGLLIGGAALIGKQFGKALIGGAVGAIAAGVPMFIVGIYDALKNGISWLSSALIAVGATLTGAGIGALIGSVGGPLGALIGLAVGLVVDLTILIIQNWDTIIKWCSNACSVIGQFFVDLWNGIVSIWNTVAEWFNTWVIQPVVSFFQGMWSAISTAASACWNAIVEFFTPAIEWFSELFNSIFQTISDIFYNIGVIASGCWEIIKAVWGVVSSWFNENIIQPVSNFFKELWTSIQDLAIAAWEGIKSVFSTIASWINDNIIQPVSNFFTDLWNGFTEKAAQAWEAVKNVFGNVAQFFGNIFRDAWQKIVNVFSVAGEIFVDIKDGVLTGFKKVANGIIGGINKVVKIPFDGINNVLKWLKNISILDIKPFKGIKTISIPQIPTFATGGFPEDGLFMANHGEMVGQFSNGRTAVANNEQIVEGIKYGVYAANQEQNVLLREQNKLLRQIVDKESGGAIDVTTIATALGRKNRREGKTIVPIGT